MMKLSSASTPDVINVQPAGEAETQLQGHWLLLARVVWIIIAALALGLYITSFLTNFTFLDTLCKAALATCQNTGQLTANEVRVYQAEGISLNFYATYQTVIYVFFTAIFTIIGMVIFWRKSDDRMALFASLALVTFPGGFNTAELATLPAVLVLPGKSVALLGDISIFLFFYLFPTGRFVPRWMLWVWLAVIVFWAVDIFFPSLLFSSPIFFTLLLFSFICSAIVAQVYRYRRVSSVLQRQQTKWVVFGIAIGLGSFLVLDTFFVFFPLLFRDPLVNFSTGTAVYLVFLLIPLSIAVAILRSRLFDIDLIINRTLVYVILTACVVGLYILVVGGLSTLFQIRSNLFISLLATGLVAILFQPLRSRLQSAVNRLTYGDRNDPYRIISQLGERLEATLIPDAILPTVVETVAQALKLPYVAIELQEEEQVRLVATYGTSTIPALRIPLRYQQETLGQLLLAARSPGESFSAADHRLLDDLARQAGVAAHAVRLSADLQHSRERLLLAQEEERRRLARELHDSVSQALYGISLGAHTARTALDRDPSQLAEPLDYVLTLAEAALAEMRALIFELRPESLETEGLISALTKQAAAVHARNNIVVSTELCDEPELALMVKQELYRIAQEALHNTVKHARANKIDLRLEQTAEEVMLEVRDDGVGFDTTASFPGHLGLRSMRERVANLGGTFEIESALGTGTRIAVHIPAGV